MKDKPPKRQDNVSGFQTTVSRADRAPHMDRRLPKSIVERKMARLAVYVPVSGALLDTWELGPSASPIAAAEKEQWQLFLFLPVAIRHTHPIFRPLRLVLTAIV